MALRIERGRGWAMVAGDCFAAMARLGGAGVQVDHVITDPPYEKEAHAHGRRLRSKGAIEHRPIGFSAITEGQRFAVAWHVARLARRWALVFCQGEALGAWRDALVLGGLAWRRGCVWIKPDSAPQFTGDRPGQGFEGLAVAHVRGASRWNGHGRRGVFVHAVGAGPRGARAEHDTIKPQSLMGELVELFTDRGDLVLDPFAGSGSTGTAAIVRGRRFLGIERDEKSFALAVENLRAAERGLSLEVAREARQEALFDSVGE